MKIKITIPNDYDGHKAEIEAIDELYGGDKAECESDEGRLIFDRMAEIAKLSGLKYLKSIEYGAVWRGTQRQAIFAKEHLPKWASIGLEDN
jgi:hypothetical protein